VRPPAPFIFAKPVPAPLPDCVMLSIGLRDDGGTVFAPGGDADEVLARLRPVLHMLVEFPSLLRQACGHRDTGDLEDDYEFPA
jgi:hypothetical protein